eukprot:11949-Hanusia_phi.AAC.3
MMSISVAKGEHQIKLSVAIPVLTFPLLLPLNFLSLGGPKMFASSFPHNQKRITQANPPQKKAEGNQRQQTLLR